VEYFNQKLLGINEPIWNQLEELHLERCESNQMLFEVTKCRSLVHLSVNLSTLPQNGESEFILMKIFENNKNLESVEFLSEKLNVSTNVIKSLKQNCLKLSSFATWSCCDLQTLQEIINLINSHNIKYMEVDVFRMINFKYEKINENHSKLTHSHRIDLNLEFDNIVLNLIQNCKNLTFLTLKGITHLNMQHLCNTLKTQSKLQKLQLTRHNNLTTQDLKLLLETQNANLCITLQQGNLWCQKNIYEIDEKYPGRVMVLTKWERNT
jgi:hypothetical protein